MTTTHAAELEARLLDTFWAHQAASGDRLELLKAFAALVVPRPPDWDPAAVRAGVDAFRLTATDCFCCRNRSRPRVWHHVIQVQHGGSNYARNRVALCNVCHADVHPWLPATAEAPPTFESFADVWPRLAAEIDQFLRRRKDSA